MTGVEPPLRIVHLIAEYSQREAMGRTVTETARNVDARHTVITARAHDDPGVFEEIVQLGGPVASFPLQVRSQLRQVLARIEPDIVHLHAGALGPLLALAVPLSQPVAVTMYAWPALPAAKAWRTATYAQMRASNVLQARVALTTVLPAPVVRAALRRLRVKAVLSPDPRVRSRLGKAGACEVIRLPSGAPVDPRRARWQPESPTILFAGRAESVRGVDTLLQAFPLVLKEVPDAKLRLLMIARPELQALLTAIEASPAGAQVEVVQEPVEDLLAEMASAQVGVWPFKFDYTTSPPAMAVAEALAVGLPVVSTPVACVRAVLRDGENGIAVTPGDPQLLAKAITGLLTDERQWQHYSEAGVRSVAEMTWENAGRTTAAYYRSLLDD